MTIDRPPLSTTFPAVGEHPLPGRHYYRVWYDDGAARFSEVIVHSGDRIDVLDRASFLELSEVLRRDGVPNRLVVVIIETTLGRPPADAIPS